MEYREDSAASAAPIHEGDGCDPTPPLAPSTKYRRETSPDYSDVQIIRSTDGGALRTFSGAQFHENGWFASRKGRRLLHWEGASQLAFIVRAETEFNVVRVATESVRFRFLGDKGWQEYTADAELISPSGQVTVVEIKRDERDLRDPDYRAKLLAVAHICLVQDWQFKIVFGRDIFRNLIHRRNVMLFASRAFARVDHEHLRRFDAHVARFGTTSTFGNLAQALEPSSIRAGEAIVQALTVARRVEVDLCQPLLDETSLTLH